MKSDFWYTVSLRVLPALVYVITSVWFRTCRVRVHGQEHKEWFKEHGRHHIESFFHYGFLYIFYNSRHESGVAMVSASRDGEYIDRLAKKFGLKTVRGSSNRGGMKALKSLIRLMRSGCNAGIVADGSQGPARVVQSGTIMLASRTETPILPMVWSCNRYIRIKSWDGTAIPWPFSKIEFFYGEPLEVPAGVKGAELEEYRKILQERLDNIYAQAWKIQGKREH